MKTTKSENKFLTQNELVSVLQEKGFGEINARQLADWRKRELLPAFDLIGGGRGKGQGRAENGWLNRRAVVRQAIRILRLRKLYPSLDDLYFPLWILGYPIPNDRVREALSEPLDFMLEDLEEIVAQFQDHLIRLGETRTEGIIEDIINDAVYPPLTESAANADTETRKGIIENNAKVAEYTVPPESIEAGMNIFLNPDYRLEGVEFEDALSVFNAWQENSKRARRSRLHQAETLDTGDDQSSFGFIFSYAPFFKENLSLTRLAETTAECSDENLEEVQRDMRIVTEIATAFGEMIMTLAQDLPQEFKPPSFEAFLPMLFSTAKLAAWTDISLRDKGFGEIINHLRRELPVVIRRDLTQEKKREIAELSPQFAAMVEKSLTELEETFKNMGLAE
jgi:hypothetical protein